MSPMESPLTANMMANSMMDAARVFNVNDSDLWGSAGPTDREVRRLGSFFEIEDFLVKRLEDALERRQDTKPRDIAKLYELLGQARHPTRYLELKIDELDNDTFLANFKHDECSSRLVSKYELDDEVRWKLAELRVRRPDRQEEDLERLSQHLEYSIHKSWTALALVKKLVQGRVDELPDLSSAQSLMNKFDLDVNARSKLRDVVEKRVQDIDDVLAQLDQILQFSAEPSLMLVNKVADTYLSGEMVSEREMKVMEKKGKRKKKEAAKELNQKKQKKRVEDASSAGSDDDSSDSGSDSSESSSDSSSKRKKKKSKKAKKKDKNKKASKKAKQKGAKDKTKVKQSKKDKG